MFEHGNDEELLLFNLCGPGRGGISIPGPLWASTSELTVLGMPHLNQIVGHTPVYSARELEEQGFRGERFIACDTFSTDLDFRPLGDGSILLADDETHEMRAVTPEEVDCDLGGSILTLADIRPTRHIHGKPHELKERRTTNERQLCPYL